MKDGDDAIASLASTGLLVLNPDVEIVPIHEFPVNVRQQLSGKATDYILSDRSSRIGSQRIEAHVALFLRRFREPRRIVEAVLEHSSELGGDPAEVLNDVYPLVSKLRLDAILIDPAAAHRRELGPGLSPGDRLEGYRVIDCVSDLAETEVFKAESEDGSFVAIKYLRSGSDDSVRANLRRESTMLQSAAEGGSAVTPHVHAASLDRDDPYLIMDWFDGQTLFDVIRIRNRSLRERSKLVLTLLEAYCDLHRSGVLHGDVHPRNAMVMNDGSVRLIDFGGAVLIDGDRSLPRIGLVPFYEPEVAVEVLAGRTPPLPSRLGEQYTVAAMAYLVIAQGSHLALSLETENALRQIADEPARSLEEMGVKWPEVENVLARALRKSPDGRYATITKFSEALSQALGTTPPLQTRAAVASNPQPIAITQQRELLDLCVRKFTSRYGLGTELIRSGVSRGPTASLYAGAAGIAYAFLRVACLRQDTASLGAADVWISRALGQRMDPTAFTDGSIGAATETGKLALYHSETGLHALNALIRYASGDVAETRWAVRDFVRSVPAEALYETSSGGLLTSFSQDATNGAPGLLLGAALLRPLCGPEGVELRVELDALARDLSTIVERQLSIPARYTNRFLGFAHGRAGAAYALLRWSEVSGTPSVSVISSTLDELAAIAAGHGNAWPIEEGNSRSPAWTGWCHGSAGHLLLWTAAARVLREPAYLDLASQAANHIWRSKGQSGPSLCCGGAGEALSLLTLARACGDNMWIDRGLELASHAVQMVRETNGAQGLFRSDIGIALAAAEAMVPETSTWPICQPGL